MTLWGKMCLTYSMYLVFDALTYRKFGCYLELVLGLIFHYGLVGYPPLQNKFKYQQSLQIWGVAPLPPFYERILQKHF